MKLEMAGRLTPGADPPRHTRFEVTALLPLSMATVGTAWCSYQAAAWGGVSQGMTNRSAASSRRAVTDQLQGYQMGLLDVLLFSQHMNARAGSNEALAQFYSDRFRDGDDVLEYAQRLASSPGTQDGLYWSSGMEGEDSPLGPLVAQAQAEGYFGETPASNSKASPEPFHGYLFRILTRQGKHAPGGKYDYVIKGNMIGGFALLAWPAEYGPSGIMPLIVNQQGRVYQKDLGPTTGKVAKNITAYDPNTSWQVSRE